MARTILDGIIFSGLVVLFMIGIILTGPSMLAGQEEIYPRSNVFPLGLYAVDNKSGMQTVKNAGFNFVHIYDGGMSINGARSYLQAAQDVGIKVKMNMPDTHYHDSSDSFWIDYVKACSEYNSLAWWYIPEETYDHDATTRLVNIIKTYDPQNRPACTYSGVYSQLKNFMDIIDVMEGGVYYPYDNAPRISTKVWIDEIVAHAGEGDIAINVPQLFGFGGGCPSARDVRHDAYLGLVAGAKGLDWYAYYYVDANRCYEAWDEVKQIVYEMGGESQDRGVNPDPLGPVILAPDIPQTMSLTILSGPTQVTAPSWAPHRYYSSINWLQKQYNDATYLIAVNTAESPVQARFGNLPGEAENAQVMFENRNIAINNGSFSDTFEGVDVHVYKIGTTSPNIYIVSSSLPNGIVGESYTSTLQANNGIPPYVWSLISGNLPDGLNLSSNGVISGIPKQVEKKSFALQVTDAVGSIASKQFSIDINAHSSLVITTSSLADGTMGEKYNATLQASYGAAPYIWSLISGNLPTGLNLNSDGVVNGVPIHAEQQSFTIQVKDNDGSTATKQLSITINALPKSDFKALQIDDIIIDGNLNEFAFSNSVSFADNSNRGSKKDNSAVARIMWDNSNLYIGVEITDTELNAIINEDDNTSLYRDDCIEVFIDPDDDGGNNMQSDDYRYTINLNENVLDGNGFNGWNWDGNIVRKVNLNGSLNNNNDTDIGYTIEVAIPWNDLGTTPVIGKILGLQIGITDRDEEASYEYFSWTIDSSNFNNPDGWAKVALESSPSQPTAALTLSDPSPTKSGSNIVTLVTSTNVVKIPTPLIFEESDGTTTTIQLTGSVPGIIFEGKFIVNNKVADGIGNFSLLPDALEDESGNIGNTIISGISIRIDKKVPEKPRKIIASNK